MERGARSEERGSTRREEKARTREEERKREVGPVEELAGKEDDSLGREQEERKGGWRKKGGRERRREEEGGGQRKEGTPGEAVAPVEGLAGKEDDSLLDIRARFRLLPHQEL
eukprot:3302844-Rhodomonas_salina.2